MVSPRENVEWNYVKGNILLCPWRLPFRLYPLSILSLSRANPRPTNEQAKGYKRTDPCVSPLFPLIFSPSLSLSRSVHYPVPSILRLSLLFSSVHRKRERGKILLFLEEERKKLFSFLLLPERERERGGKKEKIGKEESSEEHLLLVARRIEGEVSWPEPWVQQGAPGEIPSHGYWFTMPRIIRHYLMWYMGSRGQRFSRLERERERERSAC